MASMDILQNIDTIENFSNNFKELITYDYSNNKKSTEKDYDELGNTKKLNNLDEKEIKNLEKKLNNTAASLNFDLKFQIHRDTGKILVKIIDKKTHKLIREIPSESFLNFLKKFDEMLGILFDKNS